MSSILDKCAEMDEEARMKLLGRCLYHNTSRKPTSIIKDTILMYLRAILAGMCIALGGCMYLGVENKVVGAFLFSFGLMAIMSLDLPLFTGQVGYLGRDKHITPASLFITLFGNTTGTNLISWIIIPSQWWATIDVKVDTMVRTTLSANWYSTLFAAIGCGMFMYIAVEGSKRYNDIRGSIITIMAVMGFILSGCQHCIANMFYIYVCRSTDFIQIASMNYRPMCWVGIMIIGNAIGSQLVALLHCKPKAELIFFG